LKRRAWMRDAIKPDNPYRISEAVEDGQALFDAAREHQLEGIISKEKNGKYLPGKRSDLWQKVKVRDTRECCILGYSEGKGNRSQTFGGLHIAERDGDNFIYRGKVGTGFDDAMIKEIFKQIKSLKEIKKPIPDKVMDEKISTWIEPKLIAEISFSMITKDQQFREPVFVRLRPDLV
jgi:bifunctional non-homologous end joining protein LigD